MFKNEKVEDPAASAAARVEELAQERDRAVAEAAELRRQNQSLREKKSSSGSLSKVRIRLMHRFFRSSAFF